jgi:hypothetical protein
MNEERLTIFEKKLLEEVIRPALSAEKESRYIDGVEQTLDFLVLLNELRSFYENNQRLEYRFFGYRKHGGKWEELIHNHLLKTNR